MALYIASDAALAALPAGTEYRVLADRPDLFGGKVIESKVLLSLAAAPKTYPNGVDILKGCIAPWETVKAKPLATTDAAELSAAISKLRATPDGEEKLAELVKPFLVAEKATV